MNTRLAVGTLMLAALGLLGPQAFAASYPSCYDYAKTRDGPGASPRCAPIQLSNDEAFKLLRAVRAGKIDHDYYVFLPAAAWLEWPKKKVWQTLSLLVSAVQSLYGSNAGVYFVRGDLTPSERTALLFGEIPERDLVARARYNWPATSKARKTNFPPGHHRRLYTLIVY